MNYKWINMIDVNRLKVYPHRFYRYTLPQLWNSTVYKLNKLNRKKERVKYNPITLGLLTTDRCNLRCNMCIQHSLNRTFNYPYYHQPCEDLSFNIFKKIVDKFRHSRQIFLSGVGEPFLNKDIFDMIKYGNMCNKKVIVTTNGTILHDKIDRIILSPLSSIEISLDAHNASAYYKMRGASKRIFDTVLENIIGLVENRNNSGLNIGLSYVCTKSNYKYIPDMVKLAEDLGVDELGFQNLIPSNMQGFTADQCLYEDDNDVCEVILSVDEPKSKLVVYMPILLQRTVTERLCKSHFNSLFVDAKGNVSGCARVMTPKEEYGNVFKEQDVWNDSYFRRMRRMFLDESIPLLDCCKTCVNNSKHKQILLCKSK